MENRAKQKLRAHGGFTLAEALLAVLILLMVATIMTTGIPAAKTAYEKVVLASNAEVLLSTTLSTLRNELGTAQEVDAAASDDPNPRQDIIYFHPSRGAYAKIEAGDENILFYRYYNKDSLSHIADSVQTQLISDKAATNGLKVSYKSVSYDKGIVTFHKVVVSHGGDPLTEERDFSIRVISYRDT